MLRIAIFSTILLLNFPYQPSDINTEAENIMNRMMAAINKIESMQFRFVVEERIKGKIERGEYNVKMIYKPLTIAIDVISPEKGTRIVWKEGENNGKAYVNPKGIPFNVNLDPFGEKMRKGHHTIFEMNLNYMATIVRSMLDNSDSKLYREEEIVSFDNRPCYKIIIENSSFRYISYLPEPGESIRDIAKEYSLSEYLILEKNNEIESYDQELSGKTIQVPSLYASNIILYIDKELFLPVLQIIYDDKGLFEKYEYHDLKVNPDFSDKDFKK